jgi:hypothetical protein
MPAINVSVTIRTTVDNAGLPRKVVAGSDGSVDGALKALAELAKGEADKIAEPFRGAEYRGEPDVVWSFEVVDVQLVPVPLAAGDYRWLAYGTLVSAGARPWPGGPAS